MGSEQNLVAGLTSQCGRAPDNPADQHGYSSHSASTEALATPAPSLRLPSTA